MTFADWCAARRHSFFCDRSWQGMSAFAQSLAPAFGAARFYGEDDSEKYSNGRSLTDEQFEIWISPQNASADAWIRRAQSGKRIILFDAGIVSQNIYEAFARGASSPGATVSALSAAPVLHINGNRQLPVIELSHQWPSSRPASPPIQTAWNHPNPIDSENGGIYAFEIAFDGENGRSGAVTVFRDVSLPVNLMMHTLGNRRWLGGFFGALCPSRDCGIAVYAPNADYALYASAAEENAISDEFGKRLSKIRDNFRNNAPSVPWHEIIAVILSIWIGASVFIIIPARRPRS